MAGVAARLASTWHEITALWKTAKPVQRRQVSAAARVNEIEKRTADLRSERESARSDAIAAREDAAKLRGQLEAMQAQHAELMALLKPEKNNRNG